MKIFNLSIEFDLVQMPELVDLSYYKEVPLIWPEHLSVANVVEKIRLN